jgi:hypothetical protein
MVESPVPTVPGGSQLVRRSIAPRFFVPFAWVDSAAVLVMVLFLIMWHARVTGEMTFAAGGALVLFVAMCLAYGSIGCRLLSSLFASPAGVAFQLLLGYFVFNSLLFILALCSPLGMVANLAILAAIAVLGLLVIRKQLAFVVQTGNDTDSDRWAAAVAILIACIGATIWCGDAQAPQEILNGNVIFKVWPDTFIHAREISVFAQAHGIGTVHDIKLAGGRAPIYHFASYLSPAAISALSGASAMQVYASFQLPVGIMLTGLAAFCLMGKLFGCWPGVASVIAIVLFPDRYLSYNFLSQVNLGMLYGIACAALAWMFVLDGCRRGKIATVLLGYAFLGLCAFYKAHIFVANSYLLMMFPFFFLRTVRPSLRAAMGVLATLLFCMVVTWSQTNPRVPVLRMDGSGIGTYIVQLLHDYEAGWMKQYFRGIFITEKHGRIVQAMYAAIMILLSTFGVWLAIFAVALVRGRRIVTVGFWWFPILVIANYTVMTLGLALDTRNVGTPDELVNRPLVWAYFVIASWSAAACYRTVFGDKLPAARAAGGIAFATVVCGISACYSSPNLQTFPGRFERTNFVESGSVPVCMVKTAEYLRANSARGDVIHDENYDPGFMLTALSERQLYVGETTFGGNSAMDQIRLNDIYPLSKMTNAAQLKKFLSERGIDWVLQDPRTELAWPGSIVHHPAFACGGYRLFRFERLSPVQATVLPVPRIS